MKRYFFQWGLGIGDWGLGIGIFLLNFLFLLNQKYLHLIMNLLLG
jgi:hypothetical protein